MKRIIEIIAAPPGWYARWRITPEHTMSYPVTVWALAEETDGTHRQVVGIDASGQWPGGDDHELNGDFVRYIYQDPVEGEPDDAFNPVDSPAEMDR